jgi:hypothetical protein
MVHLTKKVSAATSFTETQGSLGLAICEFLIESFDLFDCSRRIVRLAGKWLERSNQTSSAVGISFDIAVRRAAGRSRPAPSPQQPHCYKELPIVFDRGQSVLQIARIAARITAFYEDLEEDFCSVLIIKDGACILEPPFPETRTSPFYSGVARLTFFLARFYQSAVCLVVATIVFPRFSKRRLGH